MQDHWARFGPPAYVSSAAAAGFQGRRDERSDGEFVDPSSLGDILSRMPGGRVDIVSAPEP